MTRDEACQRKTLAQARLALAKHRLHEAKCHFARTGRRVPLAEYGALHDAVRAAERTLLEADVELAMHPKPRSRASVNDCFREVAKKLLQPAMYAKVAAVAAAEHASLQGALRTTLSRLRPTHAKMAICFFCAGSPLSR